MNVCLLFRLGYKGLLFFSKAKHFPAHSLLVMLLNFDPFSVERKNVGQVSLVAVN